MKQLSSAKADIIQRLQKEILSLQGLGKPREASNFISRLGPLETAFPNHAFPTGAVHEFITYSSDSAATTNGFISALLSQVMPATAVYLWIGAKRTLFPPALKLFGIEPDRIIFIDHSRRKGVLWAIEEALKCTSVSAVIGEICELSFTESRRLQLAVEQSHVTGFIHRNNPRSENTVASVTRWKISPIPGVAYDGLPGVGFPRWRVQLLKVRNGRPGSWDIEWSGKGFRYITEEMAFASGIPKRKTG